MKSYKKIIFLFAAVLAGMILFMSSSAYAQATTWQRLYDNHNSSDYGADICNADSGNSFVVGFSLQSGPDGFNAYVLKLNQQGDTIWARMFGNFTATQVYTCASSGDGGCVISGDRDSAFAIKINGNGDLVWQKYYGDRYVIIYDIIKTSDGGYIACGRIQRSNLGEGYVYKIDSLGNLQWKKIFTSGYAKFFYSIVQENDKFIVAGLEIKNEISETICFLVKLNLNGDSMWEKMYSVFPDFASSFLRIDFSRNKYNIAGSAFDFVKGYTRTFVMRIDTSGNVLDTIIMHYYAHEYLKDFKVTENNRYIITSTIDTLKGTYSRVYITDSTGNIISQKLFILGEFGILKSILIVPNSSDFMFAGLCRMKFSLTRDYYVIRTDSTLFAKPVGISNNNSSVISNAYTLNQNYPNPFNNSTKIEYSVAKKSDILFRVTDVLGRIILTRDFSNINSGIHSFIFDATNLSSGIYYYTFFLNGNIAESKTMILIK